jgi:hypothetical protein
VSRCESAHRERFRTNGAPDKPDPYASDCVKSRQAARCWRRRLSTFPRRASRQPGRSYRYLKARAIAPSWGKSRLPAVCGCSTLRLVVHILTLVPSGPDVTSVEGEEMIHRGPPEQRVIWRKRFQAQYFDFRGKSLFTRFDVCEFVKCTLLLDLGTEQLAFPTYETGKR